MILTGDDVPVPLAADMRDDWAARLAQPHLRPKGCAHPTGSRAWAYALIDRLLCSDCFAMALAQAEHLQVVNFFRFQCAGVGCTEPATTITQLPTRRRRVGGEPEVLLVAWWCASCVDAARAEGGAS